MQHILQNTFKLNHFRPGQEVVIQRLLAGQSALAIFPTGGGKSLCYQLPSLIFDGLTLVISPLIALMKDQIDALHRKGIPASRLDSTLNPAQTRAVYSDLRAGRVRLLYIAPERLANERFLEALRGLKLCLLAVDEAHCISEWGHNFRPEYLKLAGLAKILQFPRVLALTATATPLVSEGIAAAFEIPPEGVVRSGFHRPNLHLEMRPGPASTRNDRLLAALVPGPNIVYVTLQRTAEEVSAFLQKKGYPAAAYHAGLEPDVRSKIQEEFMASQNGVVVATVAFGMGVDKADIRSVIHYNLPKNIEGYAQEIGRAGRDGLTSRCTLLAAPEDALALENFTLGDTPTLEALGGMLEEILQGPAEFDVSVYTLAREHDMRNLVVDTTLTYLELDGVLQGTGPFYSEYKIDWQTPPDRILTLFDERRAQFLAMLFACGRRGPKWTRLDPQQISVRLAESRDRIIRALTYLEEQGHIHLQTSGSRKAYRRLIHQPDLKSILHSLMERFRVREQRDLERLQEMIQLTRHQGCTARALLTYFGQTLEQTCGVCGSCQHRPPDQLPAPQVRVSDAHRRRVERIRALAHPALSNPRQLARFLCGLSSPAATSARLGKNANFGSMAELPFEYVLTLVSLSADSYPSPADQIAS
ncbi:RecQ family ATP-dependent DNA helicase [bacterium]|nr:RecQ family ATP-dependent DNA helicase [bacterium]